MYFAATSYNIYLNTKSIMEWNISLRSSLLFKHQRKIVRANLPYFLAVSILLLFSLFSL